MDWQELSRWLWGFLVIPVGITWKKLDSAASRDDVERHKTEDEKRHDSLREDIRRLYQNAEADRKLVRDGFDSLRSDMHEMHIELLNKIGGQ